MKTKIHIEAIKKAVDTLFDDVSIILVKKNNGKVVIEKQGIGSIDTRSEKELSRLFEAKFDRYKPKHPDNTRGLFISLELERAIDYQAYFTEYKNNNEHKTYYFELQRWIDFLNKSKIGISEHNPLKYVKGLGLEMDFKNNFDRVPESEVYQYFKTKLVDKNMLTEAELVRYLKAAFEHKQKPKKRFEITGRTKGQTVKIFHEYYEKAGHPHGKAIEYAGLFFAYF